MQINTFVNFSHRWLHLYTSTWSFLAFFTKPFLLCATFRHCLSLHVIIRYNQWSTPSCPFILTRILKCRFCDNTSNGGTVAKLNKLLIIIKDYLCTLNDESTCISHAFHAHTCVPSVLHASTHAFVPSVPHTSCHGCVPSVLHAFVKPI